MIARFRQRLDPRAQRGFTLLEVLVALAVLAVALAALIRGGGQNASNAAYLQEKSYAQWVAMNRLTELELEPAWPQKGEASGSEEMLQREWYWRTRVEDTFDEDIRRVTVEVRAEKGKDTAALARLVGFIGRR